MLLETYTTITGDALKNRLPTFLNVGSDVTGDPAFSMFNLSLKDDWSNNLKFCHRLTDEEDRMGTELAAREAQDRLDMHRSRQGSPESSGEELLTLTETHLNDSNGNPTMLKSRTDLLPLLSSNLTHKKSLSPQM